MVERYSIMNDGATAETPALVFCFLLAWGGDGGSLCTKEKNLCEMKGMIEIIILFIATREYPV